VKRPPRRDPTELADAAEHDAGRQGRVGDQLLKHRRRVLQDQSDRVVDPRSPICGDAVIGFYATRRVSARCLPQPGSFPLLARGCRVEGDLLTPPGLGDGRERRHAPREVVEVVEQALVGR